jgi:hypothetical protein
LGGLGSPTSINPAPSVIVKITRDWAPTTHQPGQDIPLDYKKDYSGLLLQKNYSFLYPGKSLLLRRGSVIMFSKEPLC